MSDTKEIKIRLPTDIITDIDLFLRSGQARISRTVFLELLTVTFAQTMLSREPTVDGIADAIREAVELGSTRLNKRRFPNG